MQRIAVISLSLLLWFLVNCPAWALSSQDVIALKKAGVSDRTILVVAKTKVIETAAFSIEDIVAMKKAGVGEETLQMIIKEGSYLADSEAIVYGRSTQSIHNISPQEVVRFKKNGVSDEIIQSVIAASRSDDQQDRERAWRMLEDLRVRIHTRGPR